jgi:hypothetical protein
VYTGSTLGALTRIGQNDDDPDRGCCASWVPLKGATAGTVYMIAVSPFDENEPESVVLNWSPLLLGTRASNVIVGTSAADEIRGLAGNDVLRGLGGDDQIFGGSETIASTAAEGATSCLTAPAPTACMGTMVAIACGPGTTGRTTSSLEAPVAIGARPTREI